MEYDEFTAGSSDKPTMVMVVDAWANSQVGSKLWLCKEIEKIFEGDKREKRIAVYAGWYGILPFIMFTRNNVENIRWIRSFDIDPSCEAIADKINCYWVMQNWKFKAITRDVNEQRWTMPYNDSSLVINTSTEHFDDQAWFFKIPKGVYVAVQSTDMPHEEHINNVYSIEELKNRYPLGDVLYTGEKEFECNGEPFKRFMVIGIK